VKIDNLFKQRAFRPVAGAAATILCGLLLWATPLKESWVLHSYDHLLHFGTHQVTNAVVVVLMDDAARGELGIEPGAPWPRAWHAKLLDKLAKDYCLLVALDVFLPTNREPAGDHALKQAIASQTNVVLLGWMDEPRHPGLEMMTVTPPWSFFLEAAGSNNWGVGRLDITDPDAIVRRHWPFPSPGEDRSLPWVVAEVAGARLPASPTGKWLRYYGENGASERMSYHFALEKPEGYFHEKIVFIGDKERDEFRTPYTRWTGESRAGVEILATQFLNLMNGDWLRRPHWLVELLLVLLLGALAGSGLYYLRPWVGALVVLAAMLSVTVGAVLLFHFGNIWFPWLVIVGGQLPFAWLCSLPRLERTPVQVGAASADAAAIEVFHTPDYTRFRKLGEGTFGEVWLVQSAIGQWQALKVVYRKSFEEERHYNYEFEGIQKYKPVSEKHQGLLRLELISRKRPEGYYYYVMELGDSLIPGWEEDPDMYEADTLSSRRQLAANHRLKVRECARICAVLAEALDCLHANGLTHRDVKPQNVIFVNGQPKLADVGLVTHTRTADTVTTQVGTPGYMPPDPEQPGTVQADIYALGMLLYVISTGRAAAVFPELSKTLLEQSSSADFLRLNPVILKACHPDRSRRYQTAADLREALRAALEELEVKREQR
jgi:CHASE2 domain-containing sensor protein